MKGIYLISGQQVEDLLVMLTDTTSEPYTSILKTRNRFKAICQEQFIALSNKSIQEDLILIRSLLEVNDESN